MTQLCEVVITAPNPDWLADFARQLIEDRLVAGVHEMQHIRSIYRWQGEVVDKSEARIACHTRDDVVSVIIERANISYPYQVPCIVVLPITAGNPAYLEWIREETSVVIETSESGPASSLNETSR